MLVGKRGGGGVSPQEYESDGDGDGRWYIRAHHDVCEAGWAGCGGGEKSRRKEGERKEGGWRHGEGLPEHWRGSMRESRIISLADALELQPLP